MLLYFLDNCLFPNNRQQERVWIRVSGSVEMTWEESAGGKIVIIYCLKTYTSIQNNKIQREEDEERERGLLDTI